MRVFSIPANRISVLKRTRSAPRKNERRRNARFPLALPVRFRVGKSTGWGRVLNIGSGGALFTVDEPVKLGQHAELCIGWPVLLHESVHLNLVADGLIVRMEEGRAAVKFERCYFRTASTAFRRKAVLAEVLGDAEVHG